MSSPLKKATVFTAILLFAACGDEAPRPIVELHGQTMGTTFSVVLIDRLAGSTREKLRVRIEEKLEHVENLASTFRPRSELSQFNLNASTEWIGTSFEFCSMISSALLVGSATGGAFDITVGPLVNLWGFGPQAGRSQPPADHDIGLARQQVGYANLGTDCGQPAVRKSKPNIVVDLSGWAKGYAVDQLASMLDTAGINNYLVEIGGEVKVKGYNAEKRKFVIAIENPSTQQDKQYSTIHISDTGTATSGDYRNFFEFEGTRYSHTIDPRTGRPISHNLTAVTVVHESTAYADAIATALLVLGPEDGMSLANDLHLAAYFAVMTPTGLEYRSSVAWLL